MKKLGKKLNTNKETLQAFLCDCISVCRYNCVAGVPDYAPQLSLVGGNRS